MISDIKVTVQPTDIVSVVVGCSYAPVAVDIKGIIRISELLQWNKKDYPG